MVNDSPNRIKNYSFLKQVNGKFQAGTEIIDELTPLQMVNLYDSVDTKIYNIGMNIIKLKGNINNTLLHIKNLEANQVYLTKKQKDSKKCAEEAYKLLNPKEKKMVDASRIDIAEQKAHTKSK